MHQHNKTATSTSQVIAKYVPETDVPIKFGHICQIFDMHIWEMYVHVGVTCEACALKLCPVQSALDTGTHTNIQTRDGDCFRLNLASPNQPIKSTITTIAVKVYTLCLQLAYTNVNSSMTLINNRN